MGGELGAIGELASKAGSYIKEALPKIFDNELSRITVTSGEKSIRKLGPWGDVLVDSVKKWQDTTAQDAGKYYSDMPRGIKPFMKDPSVTKDIATHWQNFSILPDGELKNAIARAKMERLKVYSGLQQTGVKVGPMVEDDFPRMYPRELFEGVNKNEAVARLQKQGLNLRQVEGLLDQISGRSPKAHNYETPRKWDLPGYRRDMGVLFEDIDKGYKRLNFVKTFVPNEEGLNMIMQV